MHRLDEDLPAAPIFSTDSPRAGVALGVPADQIALRAWRSIGGDDQQISAIQPLQESRKSGVYRLVRPKQGNVVAKRSRADATALEEIVQTRLLPRIGLPALRCYGRCDDPDPGFAWLFLEDAGDVPCGPHTAHLVAEWLGLLHTKSGDLMDLPLPQRTDDHYLRLLRGTLENVAAGSDNTRLTDVNRRILDDLCAMCAAIERQWPQVIARCAEMPATVLHGDLVPKNIRVRTAAAGDHIVALDWETAGWGVPAVDILSGVIAPHRGFGDMAAYLRTVQVAWPQVDLATVHRWGALGMLFRLLASIFWTSGDLNYRWLPRVMANLELYLNRLNKALQALLLDQPAESRRCKVFVHA